MKRHTFPSPDLIILLQQVYIDMICFSVELYHKYLFTGGHDEASGIHNSQ
jgi:hypothetical protein